MRSGHASLARRGDHDVTMRVSKLRIENHNRLADVEIEVRDHLVLVGANDVGKSSVLRCLQLAWLCQVDLAPL